MSIQEFRKGQLEGRTEILFNKLDGERHIDESHKHDFFVIILFDRASGVHNIDSQDYIIGDREVHVLFPGQMHKWNIHAETIGYQLMVERTFFEQFAPYFRFSFTKVYQSNPRLARFNMLIDEFYKEQKSVSFYAEKLHISANYLNVLCKKDLKVSANQLIHQRVTIEAKRLLQSGNLTIKETAYELGFSDHAYFSNFFKAQTGMTPTEFSKKR